MGGVRGVVCQLPQHVGARGGGDVHIMSQRHAIRGGAGEGMLLRGMRYVEKSKPCISSLIY